MAVLRNKKGFTRKRDWVQLLSCTTLKSTSFACHEHKAGINYEDSTNDVEQSCSDDTGRRKSCTRLVDNFTIDYTRCDFFRSYNSL